MPGPLGCPRFQEPPAGQHDADHRRGEQLTDGHRPGHRQQRDHIHAEPAGAMDSAADYSA